jgi:hypothetical protein
MGREEQNDIAALLLWEFLESGFDILGDSLAWRENRCISGFDMRRSWALTSMKPGCVPHRSMTLQLIPEKSPALLFR